MANTVEIAVRVRDLATPTLRRIGRTSIGVSKGLAGIGAASGAVKVLAGVAGAAQQLAPAALILPGALAAGAAAMGTFKLATSGVAEAISGNAEALANLTPEARDFVSALSEAKPQVDDLKKSLQSRLFANFGNEIRDLGGKYFPILKEGMGGIATEMNAMGRGVAFALKQASAQEDVQKVLSNTTKLFGNMRQTLGHVTSGVLGLAGVGSSYLPRLGTHIDSVASKFKNWVDQGVESGAIKQMIDGAIQGFKDLGGIIGNIGSIVTTVFTGLAGGGAGSPLASLRAITGEIANMLKTAESSAALQSLGSILRTIGTVVGDIVVTAFRELGPPIGRLLNEHGPALEQALKGIGIFITRVVIPALAQFIDWLTFKAIPAVVQFALVMFREMSSVALIVARSVDSILGVFGRLFSVLALIPGPFQRQFGQAAAAVDQARGKVSGFISTMEGVRSKAVTLLLQSQAEQKADSIRRAIASIPNRVVTVTVNQRQGAVVRYGTGLLRGNIPEYAAGGPIHGPGSGTSDTAGVFALSNGEHVWTAKEVRNAGGHGAVEAMRKRAAGMASGGRVGSGSSGSGGGTTVTFAGNIDGAFANAFMHLVRTGKIQIS